MRVKNESGVNFYVAERSIDSPISMEAGVRGKHENLVPWELMEIFGKGLNPTKNGIGFEAISPLSQGSADIGPINFNLLSSLRRLK